MGIDDKLQDLRRKLAEMNSLAVAFSGGVDSSFLLQVAFQELGDNVLAVTACSGTYPQRELEEARKFCSSLGIRHIIVPVNQLQVPEFLENPYDRCYICKHHLFTEIKQICVNQGIQMVADGSNLDDMDDFRPGMRAIKELEISTPLLEVALTKGEIRQLSQQMGLPIWNKPASACLASRIPYGEPIDSKRLAMIEQAEDYLLALGLQQVRVRMHGDLARIEVGTERHLLANPEMMDKVNSTFKKLGFAFVTMDLAGYQSGCFNPHG